MLPRQPWVAGQANCLAIILNSLISKQCTRGKASWFRQHRTCHFIPAPASACHGIDGMLIAREKVNVRQM
jgi:hypothetical protein